MLEPFSTITGIIGVLNGLNSTVKLLSDTGASIDACSNVLNKCHKVSDRLNRWEQRKLSKAPLSSSEAIQLASARAKARQAEEQLRSHLIMLPGGQKLWAEAQAIKRKSEKDREIYMRTVAARRRERKRKVQGITIALGLVAIVTIVSVGSYYMHDIWQATKLENLKQKLEKSKTKRRNMLRCGRERC